ncbi:hypothetical protein [Micromonospora sp. CPCC 206061]|uniref:hypothetical protein n=1 Tax=Micromonospora sp. CPCC 206061 TaxID=3122410 RepID=UPI002FF39E57
MTVRPAPSTAGTQAATAPDDKVPVEQPGRMSHAEVIQALSREASDLTSER